MMCAADLCPLPSDRDWETEEEVEKKLQEIMERYDLLTSHEEENDKK